MGRALLLVLLFVPGSVPLLLLYTLLRIWISLIFRQRTDD